MLLFDDLFMYVFMRRHMFGWGEAGDGKVMQSRIKSYKVIHSRTKTYKVIEVVQRTKQK